MSELTNEMYRKQIKHQVQHIKDLRNRIKELESQIEALSIDLEFAKHPELIGKEQ